MEDGIGESDDGANEPQHGNDRHDVAQRLQAAFQGVLRCSDLGGQHGVSVLYGVVVAELVADFLDDPQEHVLHTVLFFADDIEAQVNDLFGFEKEVLAFGQELQIEGFVFLCYGG